MKRLILTGSIVCLAVFFSGVSNAAPLSEKAICYTGFL